jgi:hypothetical protein
MTVARRCRFLQTPRAMRKAKLYCIGRPRERMANGEPRPGATRHSLLTRSLLVEPDGIEPTTSCLQSTRSPN